ncbi:PadR family transcriptional regulator [Clostridium sp. 'deep sea']|uniref:PadR family transcriptional regulator n=1 Tax=Clostridium sp. 'deep sea' TaxID=2779445 RepID=UPI001896496C|nr:PadR family transcriptional regulator [Clostridium sp. 'deep sea']QOR36041.1 PadR family transcriptional regulator [Clostridium sp. 'deep sea']
MKESIINSNLIRGNIDTIILRVLITADSYGYQIIKTIYNDSEKIYQLKEPSLYTSLRRLEKQRYIKSYWGNESQGGRRKYYSITASGKLAYHNNLSEWKQAQKLINKLIESQKEG